MSDSPAGIDKPAARAPTVRRRHVFYLSGFDPQGPAHYHRLYAEEAAKQATVSGFSIEVGPRERAGPHGSRWSVDARWPAEGAVASTIEFLRWDDIVRAHWPRSRWAVMLSALGTTGRQLANGVLWRILKTSWPAFLVLFLPPLLVIGLLALMMVVAGLALGLVLHGPVFTALVLTAVLSWILMLFARWAEAKVQMAWLMRSTRFILRQARSETPDLEARLSEFAERLHSARVSGEVDEVLVVGHSSGAMLAVSTLARALRLASPAGASTLVPVSLVTLGECIPMLSYQPESQAFRSEMASLATSDAVAWVDFTAPADGCCFALVDPTAVCSERATAASWTPPKRLSPRFAQLFEPTAYRRVQRDKYRCHFQYLMAGQLAGPYDYFAITAGAQTLAARFADFPGVEGFRDFQLFGGPSG